MLDSTEEVERRLIAAAPGALELIERLEAELPIAATRSRSRCRSRSTAAARASAAACKGVLAASFP